MRTGQRLYRYYDRGESMVSKSGNTGTIAFDCDCRKARDASAMLREHIEMAIHRFAHRWGIPLEDAQHLLLNTGVRLPKKFMLGDR